jgi:hypothetical protein
MYLRVVARPDGTRCIGRGAGAVPRRESRASRQALAEKLTAAGAREILAALIHEQ